MAEPRPLRQPLPQEEFEAIFSRVPRLTVEVVIADEQRGVLLAMRDIPPCQGLWHLPGGTVRFGEPATDAVRRVAEDELGVKVEAGELLGYIEYPSHYMNGLDSPVGLAFRAIPGAGPERDPASGSSAGTADAGSDPAGRLPPGSRWFHELPDEMHAEQRDFLLAHLPFLRRRAPEA